MVRDLELCYKIALNCTEHSSSFSLCSAVLPLLSWYKELNTEDFPTHSAIECSQQVTHQPICSLTHPALHSSQSRLGRVSTQPWKAKIFMKKLCRYNQAEKTSTIRVGLKIKTATKYLVLFNLENNLYSEIFLAAKIAAHNILNFLNLHIDSLVTPLQYTEFSHKCVPTFSVEKQRYSSKAFQSSIHNFVHQWLSVLCCLKTLV